MYCPLSAFLLVNGYLPSVYPPELEIKETTETDCSASLLGLEFNIFKTLKIFKIINFPYLCNIPSSPTYDVYISHLIRYARVSTNYSDFLECH